MQIDSSSNAIGISQKLQTDQLCALSSASKEESGHCTLHSSDEKVGGETDSSTVDAEADSKQALVPMPCIQGINQVALVLQPDGSTQYMLLSEDRALREAAAKQAARAAEEQGLVGGFPRFIACHTLTILAPLFMQAAHT